MIVWAFTVHLDFVLKLASNQTKKKLNKCFVEREVRKVINLN